MKGVVLKLAVLVFLMFSLVSLIPLLPNQFYKGLTVFILLSALIAGLMTLHLKRTNSLRIYGWYLTAIAFIYGYANYTASGLLFYAATRGALNFKSVWLILFLVILISLGIYAIVKGGRFFPVSANRIIIVSLLLLLAYVITELPIYNHYPYNHGHSLWRSGHLH